MLLDWFKTKSGVFPPSLIGETLEHLYKQSQQLEREYKFTFDEENWKMNKDKQDKINKDKTILWLKIMAIIAYISTHPQEGANTFVKT